MPDQRFTIIIVPHASSRLRKLHVSARFLLSALIGIALLVLACVGTMIHYVKLNLQAKRYEKIQQDNQQLKASLAESQALTQKLTRKISGLTDLSNKLRVMAGLPMKGSNNTVKVPPARLGIGGVSLGLGPEGGPDPERLQTLQKRAEFLESDLNVLSSYFKDRSTALNSTPSILPTQGFISSTFGARRNPFTNAPDFHEGLDISNEVGTPIMATADGVVIYTGEKGGFGQVIEIRNDESTTTLFGHLEKILVKPGDKVKRWQKIGLMGNSGRSTGPHLHYEVHVNDQPVNPLPYILDLDSIAG